MNIRKIKYCAAVAIITVATAFCGCDDKDEEIIEIESVGSAGNVENSKMHGEEGKLTDILHGSADHTENDPGTVKVYVCGAVRNPDVYELSREDRMMDAVEAAGGFESGAAKEYLNLAATLSDGEKIYIPTNAEIEEALLEGLDLYGSTVNITTNTPGISSGSVAGPDADQGSAGASDAVGMVNINSADKSTLMTLPGIGESKADKIIDYRQKNGGFRSIEDIMLVGGIKEGLYNKVKDKICVE